VVEAIEALEEDISGLEAELQLLKELTGSE